MIFAPGHPDTVRYAQLGFLSLPDMARHLLARHLATISTFDLGEGKESYRSIALTGRCFLLRHQKAGAVTAAPIIYAKTI
jgi:hypothetical protein